MGNPKFFLSRPKKQTQGAHAKPRSSNNSDTSSTGHATRSQGVALSNIAHPESLALDAVKELCAPVGSRQYEDQVVVNGVNVTVRNYQKKN